MKKFQWVRIYLLLLIVTLFTLTAFTGIKESYIIYRKTAFQKAIARSDEGIANASDVIIDRIGAVAKSAGREQYDRIMELVRAEDDNEMSERELESLFRTGYAGSIKTGIGEDSSSICASFNSYITDAGLDNVSVYDNDLTAIDTVTDENGSVISLLIRNVTICYDSPVSGRRSDNISYRIQFPDAVFHSGSDELFSYCMASQKGIYITGKTSSVIGDIFAGKHTSEECREAESVYGETGTFGGLNILSTQLGVRSDIVVSTGDININGSFVMFTPNTGDMKCYAQRLNEIKGFYRDSSYTMDGTLYPTYKMSEETLTDYYNAINLIEISLSGLDGISVYYDSDNDGGYECRYRKLLSNSDIEIRDDFAGIVATPKNVIIDSDVNVEGLILCGDRIYAMGNNNIVANAAVARTVLDYESDSGYGVMIGDYIGGMKAAGLTDPDHYVVPYR